MSAKSKTEPAPPRAARNVKTVPIDAIHIDPGNVRVHPEKNKATIRASLARFGAGRSIVLDGHNVVRAGNGTVEQAREAGYTEVLVVEPGPNQIVAVKRPDWSDSVGTAYSIADNTSTDQSEDDQSKLAATLEALRNDGFDLAAVGYIGDEVQNLIDRLAGEIVDDPQGEWEGMPEAEHEDLTAEFKVHIHIRNENDLRAFEMLVGQTIPRDRWAIWFPPVEIGHYKDKRYAVGEGDESEVSGLCPDQGAMAEASNDPISGQDRCSLQGRH